MFQGTSSLQLDGKGRLTIPSRYRDAFEGDFSGALTVTRHPDGCLIVFGRSKWLEFRERIVALPMSAQGWKRIFLGSAMDVELDATGRILISPELRAAAGLSKEALLMGVGNYFELWDKKTYEAKEALTLQGEIPAVFEGLSF